MRFVRVLGIGALVLVALASAGTARAQSGDPPPAETEAQRRGRELYENGALLYDEGRYEDAIIAWKAAYDLTQRAGFLFNIANAEERLARYDDAIDTLGRYRALAKAEERETLDRRIRNLEERRAEQAAATPDRPVPSPVPVPMPDPEPAGRVTRVRPLVGWALVGGGVAGFATGIGFGLNARAAGNEAEQSCIDRDGGLLCPSGAGRALTVNRRSALVADVSFGTGLALVGSGVVVLLTSRDRTVSVAPTRRGVSVAMTW